MKSPWAICLAREDAGALAPLRLARGLEVGEEGPLLWLRGRQADERLAAQLAALPAQQRYDWLLPNQLRALGQRIPSRQLPELQWQALSAWVQVELPSAALPGTSPPGIPLRLVRSTCEQEPELLLTQLEDLKAFAAVAAQVRLKPLEFAADGEGAVLVRGRPLPPLPGRRFVLHGGVAVPAGCAWEPAVSPEVLARCFGVASGSVVVWAEDGVVLRLHSEQFVPLSRSALRATEAALQTP